MVVQELFEKIIAAGVLGWVALVTQHVFLHPRKDKKQKDILFNRLREIEDGGRKNIKEAVGVQNSVGIGDHSHCPTCSAPIKRVDRGQS